MKMTLSVKLLLEHSTIKSEVFEESIVIFEIDKSLAVVVVMIAAVVARRIT